MVIIVVIKHVSADDKSIFPMDIRDHIFWVFAAVYGDRTTVLIRAGKVRVDIDVAQVCRMISYAFNAFSGSRCTDLLIEKIAPDRSAEFPFDVHFFDVPFVVYKTVEHVFIIFKLLLAADGDAIVLPMVCVFQTF